MAEHSYFFNSIPEDPRVYQASDFANYFKVLTQNGVYKNENDLEVTADGISMKTVLKSGSAFIEGYRYDNDDDLELTHGTAEANYDRIDLIVLRLDRNQSSRFIKAFVKQGTPSLNPVAPDLVDDGFIKEIPLAEVRIIAGQSYISQSNVSDKRGVLLDPIIDGTKLDNLINTSEIVESGSNSNGEYIRWANGWQICYNTNFQLVRVGTTNLQREWVFPASFSIIPHVGANTLLHDNNGLNTREATPVYVTARSLTSGVLIIRSLQDFASGSYAHVSTFALGWWK